MLVLLRNARTKCNMLLDKVEIFIILIFFIVYFFHLRKIEIFFYFIFLKRDHFKYNTDEDTNF